MSNLELLKLLNLLTHIFKWGLKICLLMINNFRFRTNWCLFQLLSKRLEILLTSESHLQQYHILMFLKKEVKSIINRTLMILIYPSISQLKYLKNKILKYKILNLSKNNSPRKQRKLIQEIVLKIWYHHLLMFLKEVFFFSNNIKL